jgi:hypothetical protein
MLGKGMVSFRRRNGVLRHPLIFSWVTPLLKSASFMSPSQAESPHFTLVLLIGAEFRERITFGANHEKIGSNWTQPQRNPNGTPQGNGFPTISAINDWEKSKENSSLLSPLLSRLTQTTV